MLLLESSDRLILDAGDRFQVGELDNGGAAVGPGLLGLFWRAAIRGAAADRVACPIEELEVPNPEFGVEITETEIRLTARAEGAVRLTVWDADDDSDNAAPISDQAIADVGETSIPFQSDRAVNRFRVSLANSRGSALTRLITADAPGIPTRYRVVKDPFPLKFFAATDRLTFAARLAARGGRLLRRGEIASCRCKVYRLIKNSRGHGRVPADTPFGAGVDVPLTAIRDELSADPPWRRDAIGGNFRWTPGVPLGDQCGEPGFYDVVFTVELAAGGSFSFDFSIPIADRPVRHPPRGQFFSIFCEDKP